MITPYFLILVSGSGFPFRSLYALGLLRAICASVTFDKLLHLPRLRRTTNYAGLLVGAISVAIIVRPIVSLNKVLFGYHGHYIQQITLGNGSLSRVEDVLAENDIALSSEIPILNVQAIKRPPRTIASQIPLDSQRSPSVYSFSPGMFLTLIDKRFYNIVLKDDQTSLGLKDWFPGSKDKTVLKVMEELPEHGKWPSVDSVFLSNGVVVILN